MYRKEECLSLLKDPEQPEVDDDNLEKNERTPPLKWHKVKVLVIARTGKHITLMEMMLFVKQDQ